MAPRVSVIVPVRDGERELPALLDSIERQDMAREDFEVVVADNGSSDRSAEVARRWGASVVSEREPGRARARNRATAAARGELLAFTDADCVTEPTWLTELTACLAHAPLVGGEVRVAVGDPPTPLDRLEALWRFRQRYWVTQEGWSATANMGMRRDAFESVGGFDASFRHIGEDVDICLRATAAGFAIGWCPRAVVTHPAETSLRTMFRRAAAQAHSERHLHLVHGREGGDHWRHPGPLFRGDWGLRRFGVDPESIEPRMRRRMLRLARLEYAGRMAGSLWARLSLRSS